MTQSHTPTPRKATTSGPIKSIYVGGTKGSPSRTICKLNLDACRGDKKLTIFILRVEDWYLN